MDEIDRETRMTGNKEKRRHVTTDSSVCEDSLLGLVTQTQVVKCLTF